MNEEQKKALAPFKEIAVRRHPYYNGKTTIKDWLPEDDHYCMLKYGQIRSLAKAFEDEGNG